MAERKKGVQSASRGAIWILLFLAFLIILLCRNVSAGEQNTITIRFRDGNGNIIAGIGKIELKSQNVVMMPTAEVTWPEGASEVKGSPAWKPFLKGEVGASTPLLDFGKYVRAEKLREMAETYGDGNVLTLYITSIRQIRYYDRSGSSSYGTDYIYEGTYTRLRSTPDASDQSLYGWARSPEQDQEWKYFGASWIVKDDLNLYTVRYVRISFLSAQGDSDAAYSGLTIYCKKGRYVTMPSVPNASSLYTGLGWSSTAGSSVVRYQEKETIAASEDQTLYACMKYTPLTVIFSDSNGLSREKAFYSLWMHISSQTITMPEVPSKTGYTAVGWTTIRGSSEAEYVEGDRIYIAETIRFYAVYKKANTYTIQFYMDGTYDNKPIYNDMTTTVYEDQILVLPEIPEREGYVNVGWRLRVNGEVKLYSPGTRIRVKGAYKFYARQVEAAAVMLHYNDGSGYKTLQVASGGSCVLPSMVNPSGYTFMGWSTVSGQFVSESRSAAGTFYEAKETITNITGNIHLYAVLADRSEERSLSTSQIAVLDTEKYSHLILVGDSRTERMGLAMSRLGEYDSSHITYIVASGSSLSWLRNTGYQKILSKLDDLKNSEGWLEDGDLPVAVVFNHGVNDLEYISSYLVYMNSIAQELETRNCRLFYMSVNPFNSSQVASMNFRSRSEAVGREFNQRIRSGLPDYTFIDIWSYLIYAGYSTDRGNTGYDTGVDDGLHYTVNTYKRIFDRMIRAVNAG